MVGSPETFCVPMVDGWIGQQELIRPHQSTSLNINHHQNSLGMVKCEVTKRLREI